MYLFSVKTNASYEAIFNGAYTLKSRLVMFWFLRVASIVKRAGNFQVTAPVIQRTTIAMIAKAFIVSGETENFPMQQNMFAMSQFSAGIIARLAAVWESVPLTFGDPVVVGLVNDCVLSTAQRNQSTVDPIKFESSSVIKQGMNAASALMMSSDESVRFSFVNMSFCNGSRCDVGFLSASALAKAKRNIQRLWCHGRSLGSGILMTGW